MNDRRTSRIRGSQRLPNFRLAKRRQSFAALRRGDYLLPFRWDVTRREQLGGLIPKMQEATVCGGFFPDLVRCVARTLALAGEADLVFVGRSPESLFDLLMGVLRHTSWQERAILLQFSRGYGRCPMPSSQMRPEALRALRAYLHQAGLSPERLIGAERPVALIDLICNGHTMHQLLSLIHEWAVEEKADWPAIRRKIRLVGILRATEPVPLWKRRKPWHWYDDAEWLKELLPRGALREVVVSEALWCYLGNTDVKVTPSYTPDNWGSAEAARPSHAESRLTALQAARSLYEVGLTPETRECLAKELAHEEAAMGSAWGRTLVQELRGQTRPVW